MVRSHALRKHVTTYVLLIGLAASAIVLGTKLWRGPLPGNQEGYSPEQPIAFSHKMHAGDLQISCLYCHYGAAKSPYAGIPPAMLCMNCHRIVTASWEVTHAEEEKAGREGKRQRIISTQLNKLYAALDLKETDLDLKDLPKLDPGKNAKPISWVKVHDLPAYTRFDHRPHVSAGVACQECHGPVQTMDVVRQSTALSMGWCVNCHRDHKEVGGRKVSPSTDCAACHY
jgi:hypothetical protein